MARLTGHLRNRIVNAALNKMFDEECDRLRKNETKIAQRIVLDKMGRKNYDAMMAMPPAYFPQDRHIYAIIGGEYVWLLCGDGHPIPYAFVNACVNVYNANSEIAIAWRQHSNMKEDYQARRKDAEAKLRALVNSFSTVERLLDAWPEGAEFIPAEAIRKPEPAPLPALLISDVNKLLHRSQPRRRQRPVRPGRSIKQPKT